MYISCIINLKKRILIFLKTDNIKKQTVAVSNFSLLGFFGTDPTSNKMFGLYVVKSHSPIYLRHIKSKLTFGARISFFFTKLEPNQIFGLELMLFDQHQHRVNVF